MTALHDRTLLALVCDPGRFSAKLQHLVVDEPHPDFPYHAAWRRGDFYYDMNTNWRKVPTSYYATRKVRLFVPPVEPTPEYLEEMIGKRSYGYFDVSLYPILQKVGLNLPGTHCMEAINDDLWFHAYRSPWIPYGAPPDPSKALHWAEKHLEEVVLL